MISEIIYCEDVLWFLNFKKHNALSGGSFLGNKTVRWKGYNNKVD